MSKVVRILSLVLVMILLACSALAQEEAVRPLVLQGAMGVETELMISALENPQTLDIGGYLFVQGTLDGYPVIVSKTQVGMVNAAATTTLAIERFHPIAIVNQGTAGGHDKNLHKGDIVIGTSTVNINSFKSEWRAIGDGMRPEAWIWRTTEINTEKNEPFAFEDVRELTSTPALVDIAKTVMDTYTKGKVVEGVIGSGDVWNKELDRIALIHNEFSTSAEEMETFAVAQVCAQMDVPFLSIRILSNNELHQESFDVATGNDCQEFVLTVAKAIIQAQQ